MKRIMLVHEAHGCTRMIIVDMCMCMWFPKRSRWCVGKFFKNVASSQSVWCRMRGFGFRVHENQSFLMIMCEYVQKVIDNMLEHVKDCWGALVQNGLTWGLKYDEDMCCCMREHKRFMEARKSTWMPYKNVWIGSVVTCIRSF